MNRTLFKYAAALVLLTLGAAKSGYALSDPEHAPSDTEACNNRLLAGHYGFTLQGTKLAGLPFTGPQVGVAMADFNGEGSFHQIDTVTIDGEVASDFTHPVAKGTYTVNPDCTGTFTIDFTDGRPTVVTNFVVVDDGREIDTVVISAGGAEGILALGSVGKKVSALRR
jgi:hypothetical protein